VSDDVTGSYSLDQFPIKMIIEKREGKLYMVLQQTGLEGFLLPVSKDKYQTTNGILSLDIQRDGETISGANIQVQGIEVTSKKD